MLPCARTRRLYAWLALAAMLLGALAPTVSRALALARAPSLQDVCRVGAPRAAAPLIPIALDAPAAPASSAALDHCPFCLPIADRLGPPPAASMHFFNADSGLAPPDAQALFFPTPLSTRRRARGPPPRA